MALIEHYIALYEEYKRILTERQYEVLWLHEIEGLSGKEIAGKLGISPSVISRHLTWGRERILQEIKREQEGEGTHGKL